MEFDKINKAIKVLGFVANAEMVKAIIGGISTVCFVVVESRIGWEVGGQQGKVEIIGKIFL